MDRLLRVHEVASRLNISRSLAYELVATGQIPAIRITERAFRIAESDLDAWIAERRAQSAER